MTDSRMVSLALAADYAAYESVKGAKSALDKQEKALKARIYEALGYADDDTKPPELIAVNSDGEPVFQVKVSYRKGLDVKYLKETHPDIYAECEKNSPVRSIKAVDTE